MNDSNPTIPFVALLALLFSPATANATGNNVAKKSPSQQVSGDTDLSAPAEEPSVRSRKHSLGSTLFVLANLIPMKDSPHFYQLNYQYRITPKDVVSVEAITWRYHAPLGIPYGRSWGDREENYPGFVRGMGLALVYKRFIWRGIYAALHVANMHQTYLNEEGSRIQTGFQLFLTARVGYHFDFFKDRLFLEPSIAATAWPINTNLPREFAAQEAEWPSYFLGEFGLHFGVNF